MVGRTALFLPHGQLDPGVVPAERGAVFVQGIAALFETPEGAGSTLLRYVANLRAFQLTHEVRIDADGLGASSEGLRGSPTARRSRCTRGGRRTSCSS